MQPAPSDSPDDSLAISARGLSKRFQSGNRELVVFENLDLDVARGERVALTGESGAGKSTLLYLLGGLDRPSGGKIYFGHKDLSTLSDQELAECYRRVTSLADESKQIRARDIMSIAHQVIRRKAVTAEASPAA